MSPVLYDICKDAVAKSAAASENDRAVLVQAAANALALCTKARREGLLALEKAASVQPFTPDYLKRIVALVVEGREPDLVLEIAANGYWMKNPQGIEAMVYYFYMRSMLLAQNGEDTYLIEEMLLSLVPEPWREGFLEQAVQEKDRLELTEQKETEEAFHKLRPSFQSAELKQKLHAAEIRIQGFSSGTIQRVVRETGRHTLTVCLYAFQEETRQKIMLNISRSMSQMLMQDVIWRKTIREPEVLAAVEKVTAAADRLKERGEIAE